MRRIVLLFTLLAPWLARADLTIVGSDLVAPAVDPVLEAYANHHEIALTTEFRGSLVGADALQEGTANLGILAAPEESDLPPGNFRYIPFAYEVAFLVVNRLSPITEISLVQLEGVFGDSAATNFSRWSELGVQGPMASRSIKSIALDSQQSIVTELFKSKVLDNGSLKPSVTLVTDNLQLNELLTSDNGAIGITNRIVLEDKLRPLLLFEGGEDRYAFPPEPEEIHYGDYPLRLAYYLVFPRDQQDELLPVLRVLLGEEQAELLERNNFVPVPENIRKRSLLELDKGA